MGKPSIFSKDYEKKMKRRRLKIIGIVCAILIIFLGIFYQVKLKDMDFNQIVYNLQAWVNSGNTTGENEIKSEPQADNQEVAKEKATEKVSESKEEKVSFSLLNNEQVDFQVNDDNGNKKFKSIIGEKYQYDISPNGKEAVIVDKNQNMFLLNVDGNVKNITKEQYVSKRGEKYPKNVMIQKEKDNGKDYIWGMNPKFIDDNTIVYKSNLPYFGSAAQNQYLWILNLNTNASFAVFKTASPNVEILEINKEKNGINVKVGNEEYILNNEGMLSKE